jgi:16S rRNA (adenine1518-N6/adenine1519-N6)-dimethyltransferase
MPAGDELPPLREVIAAHGLNAKKSLGQHFLFDLNLTRRIARAAGPLAGTTMLEIGPGPGGLTRSLLSEGAAKVIAIERDARCIEALAEVGRRFDHRLVVVAGDALTTDDRAILTDNHVDGLVRVAANLPYNVGTALLIKWLTDERWPPFWSSMTLMFQREVAERIVAKPRTPSYGRLSVLAQWRTRARILFDVSRAAFVPPPKVASTVVRIEPLSEPVAMARLGALETVTAAAFGQRRKMLRQSLKGLLPEIAIRAAGIDPAARPEQLSVAELAALARALDAVNTKRDPAH